MRVALQVIDIQNDFLPGGALAVPDGDSVIEVANRLMPHFEFVFASQDWHPSDHCGYVDLYPEKAPFETVEVDGIQQILWPRHCEQNTPGAAFADGLRSESFHAVIQKGTDPRIDSYSAFYDNGRRKQTELAGRLRAANIEKVFIVGLASEYCVKFTAADAIAEGFKTVIIEDGVRGLDEGDVAKAFSELRSLGVQFEHSSHIFKPEESDS
jgi:nicotinamidase/pyrazinamidase